MADRGEVAEADQLAKLAAEDASLALHPFAPAHQVLLASYCAALQGRLGPALSYLDEVDQLAEVHHVDHFAGRTANYRAWLLRNLLCEDEADELNLTAAEEAGSRGLREPQAQSALDIADSHLRRGELAGAAAALEQAASLGTGYAFSWKARIRHELLTARLALAGDRAEEAKARAASIASEADRAGTPRYGVLARAVGARAMARSGQRGEAGRMGRLLDDLARFAAPEAWWVTAELAGDFGVDGWWRLAEQRASSLAASAGPWAEGFVRHAGTRLDRIRSSRRSG